jgi:hypoxanthine phosphoribosyltransferase
VNPPGVLCFHHPEGNILQESSFPGEDFPIFALHLPHMTIQIKDKTFERLIGENQISDRIASLSERLNYDYAGKQPIFVVVLNGAFMFAADLIKKISIPAEVSFIRLSSYREMKSSGSVVQLLGLQEKLENRHVVVVEDIVDTGNTVFEIRREMLSQNPASLEIIAFLLKPDALQREVNIKYIGFEIADRFVVGYGLDYDGLGRNTPDLFVLKKD